MEMRKLFTGALILACLGVCGALLAGEKKMAGKMKEAKLWAAGDLKWVDDPEMAGVSTAVLWGDPKTGPYGALEKWAAGTSAALHWHTADIKAVMISGTFLLTLEGQPGKEMPSGSYVFIPGGTRHTTVCKAGADCVFFAEQPGAGDTKMVEMAK
jgi:quercetin dioxygenase-like cupin family protein